MSAGSFVNVLYEADSAEKHFLEVQPETVEATIGANTNAAATGPATSPFWFKRSRGANEFGGKPRFVRIKWDVGAAPTGYSQSQSLLIPILTAATFNAVQVGGSVTYLGSAATITRKIVENIYPGI